MSVYKYFVPIPYLAGCFTLMILWTFTKQTPSNNNFKENFMYCPLYEFNAVLEALGKSEMYS
jgi:hypothetical protein